MRDPARIHRMVVALEMLWNKYPDQRLGQLLANYTDLGSSFYLEDDSTETALRTAAGLLPYTPKPAGNQYTDSLGHTYFTHANSQCRGEHCVVHNPSNHHMRTWPTFMDRDEGYLVKRLCSHNLYHPDPDSLSFFQRGTTGWRTIATHRCDSCCNPPYKDGSTIR